MGTIFSQEEDPEKGHQQGYENAAYETNNKDGDVTTTTTTERPNDEKSNSLHQQTTLGSRQNESVSHQDNKHPEASTDEGLASLSATANPKDESAEEESVSNPNSSFEQISLPGDEPAENGAAETVVDDMPTKKRNGRGSRRRSGGGGGSSGRDGDQGRLLEPGSSQEADEQRHPHAHTNDPATRTESMDKGEEEVETATTNLCYPPANVHDPAATCSSGPTRTTSAQGANSAHCTADPLQAGSAGIHQIYHGTEAVAPASEEDRLRVSGEPGATSTPKTTRSACSSTAFATTTPHTHPNHPPDIVATPAPNNEATTQDALTISDDVNIRVGDSQNTLVPTAPANSSSNNMHSRAGSQASRQSLAASGSAASGVSGTNRSRTSGSVHGRGRQSAGGSSGTAQGAQPLQKVVYYQNRFITIPIDPADAANHRRALLQQQQQQQKRSGGSNSGAAGGEQDDGGGGGKATTTGGARAFQLNPGGTGNTADDMDPNIAAMAGLPTQQGGGQQQPDPPPPPPKKKKREMPGFIKKIAACLQDNRMRTGNAETKAKIREMNESQDSSHMVLKKILNIIFVTTGITLFLSVVIVIIYTSIGNWWILAQVPAPAGWHTQPAAAPASDQGKPGTNPGDTAPIDHRTDAPFTAPPSPPVTGPDFKAESLNPVDEDHETLPGGGGRPDMGGVKSGADGSDGYPYAGGNAPSFGGGPDGTPIEEPPIPYNPIDGEDYDVYPAYYDYDNMGPMHPDVVYQPQEPLQPDFERVRPKPTTTPRPTTTPKPTTTTFQYPVELGGYGDYYDSYDYQDSDRYTFAGGYGDALRHHQRQSLRQKLKEKQRLYKYRRRHRRHRIGARPHRGNS